MLYTVPDYYDKFYCLADKCPLSCCEGWEIVIDKNSLKEYRSIEGPFGNRLKNSVNWKEGIFKQHNKRCAFLNEKNLCDIHIQIGADMMCETCRTYPSHIEEYDNEREISLALSCPSAAKIILENENIVKFITTEDDIEGTEDEDFDIFLYSALIESRKVIIEILQNRNEDIYVRMAKVLNLSNDIQEKIDNDNIFDIEDILDVYKSRKISYNDNLKVGLNKDRILYILNLLDELETLYNNWERDLNKWKNAIRDFSDKDFKSPVVSDIELEQMMIYFVFIYFCLAVYDYDVLSKVKMAVVNTLIWENICKAESFIQNFDDNNCIQKEAKLELAYRYSRELEHSDLNLDKMEDLMSKIDINDLLTGNKK